MLRPLKAGSLLLIAGCTSSVPDIPVPPSRPPADALPVVEANDNRRTAGSLEGGVLTLRLVAARARWYPEAGDGASALVVALGEEGKPPQIPAPLIRVPEGTIIDATIRNALPDSTLWVHWLATRPATVRDSVAIAPGASRQVRFSAGAPGTYMYRATTGEQSRPQSFEREQLVGAFVIDSAGSSPTDRIFVINIWSDPGDSARGVPHREALTLNGKSWPYTEPMSATTGDTVTWRIVNGSLRGHPMHLHGFYFRVDARGSANRDTAFADGMRRLAVTESMALLSTMTMTWTPERPGNWLFHCHLSFHVIAEARLDAPAHSAHTSDPRTHMAGLVLGIAVAPAAGYSEPNRSAARKIKLFVQEGKKRRNAARAISFVQQRDHRAPAGDSVELPSSMLVLTRGEPTDIAVTNRLREPTSVHWHGIELESFSDGVAGWSGAQKKVAPVVAPGKTFTARLTLPRTGTFIYHTHLNDIEQITSGLYGAIVVLEPGERFNTEADHVYVGGWDGEGPMMPFVVNGDTTGATQRLRAGIDHRFRFVNIGPATPLVYEIRRDSSVVAWQPHAKDGADLPAQQRKPERASRRLDVGETFDALFTPERGEYMLIARLPGARAPTIFRQRLIFE